MLLGLYKQHLVDHLIHLEETIAAFEEGVVVHHRESQYYQNCCDFIEHAGFASLDHELRLSIDSYNTDAAMSDNLQNALPFLHAEMLDTVRRVICGDFLRLKGQLVNKNL